MTNFLYMSNAMGPWSLSVSDSFDKQKMANIKLKMQIFYYIRIMMILNDGVQNESV